MQIKDISHADPTKYDTIIIQRPPTMGSQEPCLLP
jgi:hypothetical protein